ncbi:YunG family protein [Novosphingobium beihaiensis]|uniref:Uncharacterized protein n=1 Tax=Novosphingobium beihaiensis TaxID=2930389 RepID=A0ABT0BUI3_9SPHN|nr:hypothetical protein [Novosphingobium beihaiensis]MCJ2188491.1 hypothetical protein [Novosphingobium beihaiensis]
MDAAVTFASPIELYHVVKQAWSAETIPDAFDPANPCLNQCAVTALAVQHYFGGDICKSKTQGGTHFYNLIDGRYWDLATDQFDEPIPYDNTPTSREEAHEHASAAHLAALIANIEANT